MTILHVRLDAIEQQARSRIRLSGPDAVRFLHGTVTADIEGLEPGHAAPAGLLTVKGKLVCEMVVLRRDDEGLDLLVPTGQAESVADLLDRHIIMDEVELERSGPVALALVWNSDGSSPELGSTSGVATCVTRHPAPGLLVTGPAEAVESALVDVQRVDARAFEAYRVETASPAWGHELGPDFFPPEVGFVHAVSYDKGCYLGQEPLARIHARGQVNRVMVRVEANRMPTEVPAPLSHPERSDAGRWTTAAERDGTVVGLAIVRRAMAAPQTVLQGPDGLEVRVVSGPLGDDPGVGSRRARA